jgi:eukaryotic-like serine/threonine-protein kinase
MPRFLTDDVVRHLRNVVDEPDFAGTRYRIEGRIGRGGMAVVYAAHDEALDRKVAIKVASPMADQAAAIERLKKEARVLAQLEHPGIVPVHDVGVLPDGHVYYAMKLVKGERLDEWLKVHPSERRAALRLFQRICEACAFAHAKGVIHRDVKPSNIMVGEFGEALLMDWGIAATTTNAESSDDGSATAIAIAGTESFMSPEQARGEADLDARSDIYSLGATLKELFGSEPVKAPLQSIYEKATSPNRDDRYASAKDLASDIESYLDGGKVTAHEESLAERAVRIAIRHRVILTLLAAYVLMRLVLIIFAR